MITSKNTLTMNKEEARALLASLDVAFHEIILNAPDGEDYNDDDYEFMDEFNSFSKTLKRFVSS